MKELYVNLSQEAPGIIIYDRGVLDRILWLKYQLLNNAYSIRDYKKFLDFYKIYGIKDYKPISMIFVTSPNIAIKRKGGESSVVNQKSLTLFNKLIKNTISTIKKHSSQCNIIYTDKYQEEFDLFIQDNINLIIDGIYLQLKDSETIGTMNKLHFDYKRLQDILKNNLKYLQNKFNKN